MSRSADINQSTHWLNSSATRNCNKLARNCNLLHTPSCQRTQHFMWFIGKHQFSLNRLQCLVCLKRFRTCICQQMQSGRRTEDAGFCIFRLWSRYAGIVLALMWHLLQWPNRPHLLLTSPLSLQGRIPNFHSRPSEFSTRRRWFGCLLYSAAADPKNMLALLCKLPVDCPYALSTCFPLSHNWVCESYGHHEPPEILLVLVVTSGIS